MAQTTWEKPLDATQEELKAKLLAPRGSARWQYLLGGFLLLGAVGYLIFSGTLLGARFFVTVDEVVNDAQYAGQTVRLTGVVLGDTIDVNTDNPSNTVITFTIANIPLDTTNLAETLNIAANDPGATRLPIYVENQPVPELLQHEAQAILTGELGEDGIFYASELQFKCPSRFEEGGPNMSAEVGGENDHPGMQVNAG